jgi:YHS domain-containing protein
MTFFARLFRFLFWIVIVSWGFRLLRRLVSGLLQSGRTPVAPFELNRDLDAAQATRLVRDPVCGVHLAEVLAIPLRENGELAHFCSTTCRDTFLNSSRKLAAHG